MKKENKIQLTSSRSVGMRDINALLQTAPISRIKTLRDDEGRRGFTLIELLVVVLIIGILTAVALPQYKKAVIRSRYATLKNLTKSLSDSQEIYYLTNGVYAPKFANLDIEVGGTPYNDTDTYRVFDWGRCQINSLGNVWCTNKMIGMQYKINGKHGQDKFPGQHICFVLTTDPTDFRNQICKTETAQETYYEISTEYNYIAWYY